MTAVITRIDEILDYWFGTLSGPNDFAPQRNALWFTKKITTDQEITQRFSKDLNNAASGIYDEWASTAKGRLALIILLDQFPRNIYRNSAKAFAYDSKALDLALEGVEWNHDKYLRPIERVFFYLPFEHSESIAMQDLSIYSYRVLMDDLGLENNPPLSSYLNYADQHREVIKRFGRFPHRNKLLGRESTTEELEFLKRPGSSF